jgi:ATP-dependent RNA helicase DeaD
MTSFENLGLMPELVATVADLDYAEPTPIQAQAIGPLLDGRDVMGKAQTGTGKTAAFTLPMLQRLEGDALQAIVLTPTRELAIQVAEAVYRYGHQLGVRVLPIYGGQSYSRQIRRLQKGVQVVVGTPGRTLDLINQKKLDLSNVHYFVLDEADEMLKMGFIEDVESIMSAAKAQHRQTAIFSATLSDTIQRMAGKFMNDPLLIDIKSETVTVDNVSQRYYVVRHHDKTAALTRLLETEDVQNTLIFTRTKVGSVELAEKLVSLGFAAEAVNGDLPQAERERIIKRFRKGIFTILVATDVVARGVDIPAVSHVINYDIPQLPAEYVHRIGRTGRAGRGGNAITLITGKQKRAIRGIEDYTRQPIKKAKLPSPEQVLRRRDEKFVETLVAQMQQPVTDSEVDLLDSIIDLGYSADAIAVAAIKLLRAHEQNRSADEIREDTRSYEKNGKGNRSKKRGKRDKKGFEPGMVRLYMDIGRKNGIKPGDVVYTFASEANISGRSIGAIDIRQHETFVDVQEKNVSAVLKAMGSGRIRGQDVSVVLANGNR